MPRRPIFGICGAAGAGKDTFARTFRQRYGFDRIHFSRPLKELCCEQFGWDYDRLDELEYKEEQAPGMPLGWTRRKVLQHIGTEGFRGVDPYHWVKKAAALVEAQLQKGTAGVVMTDMRFLNEAAWVSEQGGLLIRVQRLSGPDGIESSGHTSEQEFMRINVDWVVEAEWGDLEFLQAEANNIMAYWRSL